MLLAQGVLSGKPAIFGGKAVQQSRQPTAGRFVVRAEGEKKEEKAVAKVVILLSVLYCGSRHNKTGRISRVWACMKSK